MFTPFPQIKTERLLLRQILPEDIRHIFHGLSHPEVIKFYGVSYDTLEGTQEQMDWYASLEAKQEGIWWAVCSPDNSSFYGAGGLNDMNHEHKRAEIGFWLLPEHWGKRIMSEAMPAIMKYAFEEIGLRRIEGFVESSNENCKRGLAKMDFAYEGTMRDYEFKDGSFIDIDIYASLNPKTTL